MEDINCKEETLDEAPIARRHHTRPEPERDKFFVLRQIFNIVFIVGAIIGCFFYIKVNEMMGGILIIIAMAFKMAECVLRFRKQ
ncbi:MAG: hypothetical protein MJZ12_03920 [Prevotella sp.]|nr:hypothetical protein [Prevotella sp.]